MEEAVIRVAVNSLGVLRLEDSIDEEAGVAKLTSEEVKGIGKELFMVEKNP